MVTALDSPLASYLGSSSRKLFEPSKNRPAKAVFSFQDKRLLSERKDLKIELWFNFTTLPSNELYLTAKQIELTPIFCTANKL